MSAHGLIMTSANEHEPTAEIARFLQPDFALERSLFEAEALANWVDPCLLRNSLYTHSIYVFYMVYYTIYEYSGTFT
jgi:hypothetical protein